MMRSGTPAVFVADTFTGLSKAIRPVPSDAKFTGTVAHGKGGGLIIRARILITRPQNRRRKFLLQKMKNFSKKNA